MTNSEIDPKIGIVIFCLDEPRYALLLSSVKKVIQIVEIVPLPKAPDIILGLINYHGDIIPVVDIRTRFNLPKHTFSLQDQIIICQTSRRTLGIVVDNVIGVYEIAENQFVNANLKFPFTKYLTGVAAFENNIILINDLEKFLSLDEEKILDNALAESLQ